MRTLRGALVCAVAAGALQSLTGFWWWIAAVPLAYAAAGGMRDAWEAFRGGALGGGALWLGVALWRLTTDGHLIADRVAVLLLVGSPWLVLAATTLLATLTAALAATTGHLLSPVSGSDQRK